MPIYTIFLSLPWNGNGIYATKKVHIKFEKTKTEMRITIRDDGGGFNPDDIADPLKPENLYKESGRGIFIVRMLMDKVDFHFTKSGTEVILVKKLT